MDQLLTEATAAEAHYYVLWAKYIQAGFANKDRNYTKGIELSKEGLEAAYRHKADKNIANLARQVAYGYHRMENHKESLKYYLIDAAHLDIETRPDDFFKTKTNIGVKLGKLGRYDEARMVYDTLVNYVDKGLNVSARNRSKLYNNMATLYRNLKQGELALEYAERALATKREIKDRRGEMVALSTLLSISKELKEYDRGESYGLAALHIADSLQRVRAVAVITTNLANLYTDTKQYPLAVSYLQRSIRIAEENKMPQTLGINYLNLASLYVKINEVDKAAKIIAQAKPYVEKSGNLEFVKEYYEAEAIINAANKNYKTAYNSLLKSQLFKDSLFSEEKAKTIAELDARYEASTKENEIALLTKDAELQEVSNTKLKQQQGLLLGGGLALLIFTGLLINRYRSKQRTLQTISRQNEEITARSRENELLVREIHHRVKNNMAIMQGLLQAQRERHTHNNELEEALLVCEGQLSSMALIHQDLYRTNNFMAVDAEDYFTKLLQNIQSAYAERSRAIAFKVQLSKQELQVHQAVPLGLIMNELVTNAVKYAFPERQPGAEIRINQEAVGEELVLSVRDNGVGIAASRRQRVSSGFGLSMVKGLTRQLGGRLRQEECDGTCFEVAIPLASFVASDVERRPAAAGQAVASA